MLGDKPERRRGAARGLARLLAALAVMLTALPGGATAADEQGLAVVLDSTQHWPGTNDVLLSIYDAAGGSLADQGQAVEVELRSPSASRLRSEPAIERFATYGRRVYRARFSLTEIGSWEVHVRAGPGGARGTGQSVLEVSDDMGTPALGARAPSAQTPTLRDARSLMHHISSDPEPLSTFYTWSLDEALAQGQPTVFVLDSYAFRPNAACGGALGILHEVFIDYPGLAVIHAEPWHMSNAPDGGMLELDPRDGPPRLQDYALAWGVSEPPWVFVMDRDGRVHAKFTGVMGSDELRAALASVTPWRPAA